MNKERKNVSWILIAVIVAAVGTVLVVSTLASSRPETSAPAPTASAAAPSSAPPSPTAAARPVSPAGGTANASVIGYGGPVLVRLTLDEAGVITGLDVGGARFMETEGVGSRVKEDAFVQPFLGKQPPLALGEDIDAIAGASISSQAVVDAVNEAAAFLTEAPDGTK